LIGTSLSNIYEIIKDGLITVYDYDLTERIEFNANTVFEKRSSKSSESNSSKRESSKEFVSLVVRELRSEYNINSVDEIINDFILNRKDEINIKSNIFSLRPPTLIIPTRKDNFSSFYFLLLYDFASYFCLAFIAACTFMYLGEL